MADCFDSENLQNPLKSYQNYSYNGCVNEAKTMCHDTLCGCRDLYDTRDSNGILIILYIQNYLISKSKKNGSYSTGLYCIIVFYIVLYCIALCCIDLLGT